jgi:hypothetical protein
MGINSKVSFKDNVNLEIDSVVKLDSSLVLHYSIVNHGLMGYCMVRPAQDSLTDIPFYDIYYRKSKRPWQRHIYSSDGVYSLMNIHLDLNQHNTVFIQPDQHYAGSLNINFNSGLIKDITHLALVRNKVSKSYEFNHLSHCELDNSYFRIEIPIAD